MKYCLAACMLCFSLVAFGETIHGRITAVPDGDTLDLLTAGDVSMRVRVVGIDAPEKGQPFGRQAKAAMRELVWSREVVVDWAKRDRYGRLLGTVTVDGSDVGLAMLRSGWAWYYKQYERDLLLSQRMQYAEAESEARLHAIGLWVDFAPVPPWQWRRGSQKRHQDEPFLPY
ncbi:thermonuclease family protein [Novimethylophilus kurashikiensis]|nr:thermonuclease family protein [Novimethylophilus kurashikiensis]